jgi:SPP1 family predicted phage head-tail adaptor
MSFRSLLNSKCDIKSETAGTADGMGGKAASTWSTLYTNVRCCFEAYERKTEMAVFDKVAPIPDFVVYLEYKSGIKEGQRLSKNGVNYEIKLVENTMFLDKYMKLQVTELKRGE